MLQAESRESSLKDRKRMFVKMLRPIDYFNGLQFCGCQFLDDAVL